jgi:hypothetical protein
MTGSYINSVNSGNSHQQKDLLVQQIDFGMPVTVLKLLWKF